jgi:hypothetical protein
MRIAAVACAVVLLITEPAASYAETSRDGLMPVLPQVTEGQKWKALLPFVRATSDCFANSIQSEPTLLEAYQQNRLLSLVAAKGAMCLPVVERMIAEHDRIYGQGTGQAFFKGPYASDLQRAISVRLKPEIDRRLAEAARKAEEEARQAEERRNRQDTADRALALLRDRMYECTTGELVKLVRSSETAEVLATAAMTICNKEVEQALDAGLSSTLVQYPNMTATEVSTWRTALRTAVQRNVLTNAVQLRAAGPKASPPVPQSPQDDKSPTFRSPSDCLKQASRVREGKLVSRDGLLAAMIELCRPEIENAARAEFLSSGGGSSLAASREKAQQAALKEAQTILGAVDLPAAEAESSP